MLTWESLIDNFISRYLHFIIVIRLKKILLASLFFYYFYFYPSSTTPAYYRLEIFATVTTKLPFETSNNRLIYIINE